MWLIHLQLDHILSSLLLHSFPSPENPLHAYNFLQTQPLNTPIISILPQDSEVIWFFGDLNFRPRCGSRPDWGTRNSPWMSEGLSKRSEIMAMIESGNVEALVERDELTFLRNAKHGVLSQFFESPIKFLPSYKLNYTTKKSKDELLQAKDRTYSSKRLPAYCDRILYFSDLTRHSITSLHYTRVTDYSWSDHDPVVGLFHMEQVVGVGEKGVGRGRDSVPIIKARLNRFLNCNFRLIVTIVLFLLFRSFYL